MLTSTSEHRCTDIDYERVGVETPEESELHQILLVLHVVYVHKLFVFLKVADCFVPVCSDYAVN